MLKLPEGLERAVTLTPEEFAAQVRLMAALKMFELGKMSSGSAAQLAGVSRPEFLEICSQYQIPVADMEPGQLEEEVTWLRSYVK